MISNSITRGIENTFDSSGALVWNRLHSEREDICEAMVKASAHSFADTWPRNLMESRLRRIDDALDRLFSGSYGNCSKCRKRIEDRRLETDPAMAYCNDCSKLAEDNNSPSGAGKENAVLEGVALSALKPFDTIWVSTHNSTYRFLMLNPKTGRVLAEGGRYFAEPVEAIISGSASENSIINNEWIGIGMRMEMWFEDKLIITSAVRAIRVEHHSPSELELEPVGQYSGN